MKVLIVLAGDPPDEALLEWRVDEADFVIAADGGMKPLLHAGIQPDLLVGDFDSFNPSTSGSLSCKVVLEEDQDSTDLEKALRHLPEDEATDAIVLLGATGGRSDHFLSNLLVVSGLPDEIEVVLDSLDEFIRRVTPVRPARLLGICGQIVSLVPMVSCKGVTTSGLKWELKESAMGVGEILGQSNEAVSDEARIDLREGVLFVITPKVG